MNMKTNMIHSQVQSCGKEYITIAIMFNLCDRSSISRWYNITI